MVWENELIVGGTKQVSEHRKNVLPKEQLNEIGHMIRVEYTPDDSPVPFSLYEGTQRKQNVPKDYYLSVQVHWKA